MSQTLQQPEQNSAEQIAFDAQFITAPEIGEYVGVTKVAIYYARQSGQLPGAIEVNRSFIWNRKEIQPYIDAWKDRVQARAGAAE